MEIESEAAIVEKKILEEMDELSQKRAKLRTQLDRVHTVQQKESTDNLGRKIQDSDKKQIFDKIKKDFKEITGKDAIK